MTQVRRSDAHHSPRDGMWKERIRFDFPGRIYVVDRYGVQRFMKGPGCLPSVFSIE